MFRAPRRKLFETHAERDLIEARQNLARPERWLSIIKKKEFKKIKQVRVQVPPLS